MGRRRVFLGFMLASPVLIARLLGRTCTRHAALGDTERGETKGEIVWEKIDDKFDEWVPCIGDWERDMGIFVHTKYGVADLS